MLRFLSRITVRPVATPPFTEVPALHAAITNAMARQNDNDVRQQLAKANLSPDALQALLKHAFEKNYRLDIKKALLEDPRCDLPTRQSALELAVQYDDLLIAKQALQQGADPEKITARPKDDSMRTLLTYARRKNKLYPHASCAQETTLDRALRDGLVDDSAKEKARLLLREATSRKMLPFKWRDAVKKNQVDVQRAILLLGLADKDRSFRVVQEDAVTDKGVAEVMKEIPYFSPKRKWPKNFNGKATFPGTNEEIVCRHLVEHRQSVQERRPQIKFDDAQFASKESIAAHVSYDTEKNFEHFMDHATEAHLFHNHNRDFDKTLDFGKTLVQQFAAMAAGGEPSRLISLASTDHVMSLGLRIKEKDGKPHYVAALFDPSRTTSHVRIASDSLSTFETATLENLIADASIYKQYYSSEPESLSTMFVRLSPQERQAMTGPARGVVVDRKLTSRIKNKDINAIALFHMLQNGFAGDLRRLKEEIASRPEKERIELLAAKNAAGYPGLFMALQKGYADAIKAFCKLLPLVPKDQRTALLAAKNADGVPGLFMALKNGHVSAIRVFGELLLLVPKDQHAELLAAKDANGFPGLHMALLNGHVDVVNVFCELLLLLPPKQRVELSLLLPPKQRVKLLAAKDTHGRSGLAEALKEGKLEVLEQYMEIVKETEPDLDARERATLLKDIRKSHAVQRLGMWFNFPHYEALKKKDLDFYLKFKEMKNTLKPKKL